MEIVEELTREIEKMRKEGRTAREITAHCDRRIAKHNERMLARIRMQDRVLEAVS